MTDCENNLGHRSHFINRSAWTALNHTLACRILPSLVVGIAFRSGMKESMDTLVVEPLFSGPLFCLSCDCSSFGVHLLLDLKAKLQRIGYRFERLGRPADSAHDNSAVIEQAPRKTLSD